MNNNIKSMMRLKKYANRLVNSRFGSNETFQIIYFCQECYQYVTGYKLEHYTPLNHYAISIKVNELQRNWDLKETTKQEIDKLNIIVENPKAKHDLIKNKTVFQNTTIQNHQRE